MEEEIRVFISYSSEDKQLIEKLAQAIKSADMIPIWAKNLPIATEFDEQIKIFIQHAHIFMPILSETSSIWVHQEIGYAKALHIPVFPVTTEDINPGGMLQMIQAIKLGDENNLLKDQLSKRKFRKIFKKKPPNAMYKRAAVVEDRAEMMKDYADKLVYLDKYGLVYQKGGLSSFHIPKDPINSQTWNNRYLPESRGDNHKKKQRAERLALQEHADEAGCRLIVKPAYAIKGRSSIAARTRLETLIDFLKSMTDEKVVIAIQEKPTRIESLTIVGDWFLAESVSFEPGDGFTNTFFTRNASEILERIEYFESELSDLLKKLGWKEKDSRKNAIEALKKILESIKD